MVRVMSIQSEEEIKKAYALLEEGKPSEARQILGEAFAYDFDNQEIDFSLWCCSYWIYLIEKLPKLDPFEQAEALVARWKFFKTDMERRKNVCQRTVYALQKGIFTLALNSYSKLGEEKNPIQHSEICRKKGLCYKKLGKYETALSLLTEANQYAMSSAPVLAEMADCFALCGEDKKAKVLFREAFFIDAQKVEISFLDSELINCLIRQVKEKGFSGPVLQVWIPVYGVLYGVFNVKRELRVQEYRKLRQDIYASENELKDPSSDRLILTPKLINMYFWLIDYYVRNKEGNAKINECLLQIRVHDENVYRQFTTQSRKQI